MATVYDIKGLGGQLPSLFELNSNLNSDDRLIQNSTFFLRLKTNIDKEEEAKEFVSYFGILRLFSAPTSLTRRRF